MDGWLVFGLLGGAALFGVVWALLTARRDSFEKREDKANESD